MRRLCPSLSELQAFEAAARHLSFTRAAEELSVTQGAISRQVRELEEFLGLELFERVRKRLVLTDVGQAYFTRVCPCLDQLQAATLEALSYRNGTGGTLNLSVLPAFNARWLIPRLAGFTAKNPNIALNMIPSGQESLTADAFIGYGDGIWPRANADYLIGRQVVPICSPTFTKGKKPIRDASDLAAFPLLLHNRMPRSWSEWFDATGVKVNNALRGTRFDQFSTLIQATIAGLGVALVPRFLINDELERGLIIIPVDRPVSVSTGYYLVYPEEKRNLPVLHTFRSWLLRELAAAEPSARRELAAA